MKSFKDYCPNCKHYDSNMGVCSKLHKNVDDYPNSFIKHCDGWHFSPIEGKNINIKSQTKDNDISNKQNTEEEDITKFHISDTRVKICPKCKTINHYDRDNCGGQNCTYEFKGKEEGAKDKILKLDTISDLPTSDEIIKEVKGFSPISDTPSKFASHQVSYLSKRSLFSIGIFILGIFLLFVLWPAYKSGDFPIPGGTVLFFLGGIACIFGGIILFFMGFSDFFKGPTMTTPDKTIKTFYNKGILELFKNYGKAWDCLTPSCKDQFKDLNKFEEYWNKILNNLKKNSPSLLGESLENSTVKNPKSWHIGQIIDDIKNLSFSKMGSNSCVANFDFVIHQIKMRNNPQSTMGGSFVIVDGHLVLPQTKALIKLGDNWFLTSGELDLPKDQKELLLK